jgi:8-oxo-dGTP pyrophosphatase MutT (NUDIX family)
MNQQDWTAKTSFNAHVQSARFKTLALNNSTLNVDSKASPSTIWNFVNVHRANNNQFNAQLSPSQGTFLSINLLGSLQFSTTPMNWCIELTETQNQVYIIALHNNQHLYLGCDRNDQSVLQLMLKPGGMGQGRRWNIIECNTAQQPNSQKPLFTCPYPNCRTSGLTEDELVEHCPRYHYNENVKMICPICTHYKIGDYNNPQGVKGWGYSVHLHNSHGPVGRKNQAMSRDEKVREERAQNAATYAFALVIVQHPVTKKFLLVEECCAQGYWLPGGRVDPGETFQQAAIRETEEEAGCKVKLTGIIRVEYSPYNDGGARQRLIFYGVPENPDAPVKSIPDYESVRAVWISYEEMMEQVQQKKIRLRGPEPAQFFKHVRDGLPIYPMNLLKLEGEE